MLRDTGLIPGSRRSPEEGNGYPLQYSCLENPHGQRSLAGHSPWGFPIWRANSRKRPWCWERLKVGGERDNRGWDGWMASPTQWTWVWVNSRSWWWTGRPGVLQSMGSQRVRHNWATELNWTEHREADQGCLEERQTPFPVWVWGSHSIVTGREYGRTSCLLALQNWKEIWSDFGPQACKRVASVICACCLWNAPWIWAFFISHLAYSDHLSVGFLVPRF